MREIAGRLLSGDSGLRSAVAPAAVVFAVSVLSAAPSVFWLDSGNLVASGWTMGVAHPPGEPFWLALARLAQLLPVGDIAFRTSLVSAACLALCALPLTALCRSRDDGLSPLAGLVAPTLIIAALLGFSAQLQAVRPEVYATTLLLLLVALSAVSVGGPRGWASLGLLMGLGVGLHPLLCLAALPALLLAGVLRPLGDGPARPGRREVLGAGLGGLCGLGVMLWLPLRAAARPSAAWGVPDSPSRFIDVLLARNFSRNFGGEASSFLDNLAVVGRLWVAELVPVLLLLVLLLLYRKQASSRQTLAWVAVTALWLAGNAATILPQNKVFPSNPDLYGYLCIGAVGTLPLALRALRGLGRPALAVAVLLLLLQVGQGLQASASSNFLPRTFAAGQSAGLPPGSILMTSGNDTAFTWGYLQRVERRRSDLVLLHRVLLGHEHENQRLGGPAGQAALGVPWVPELQANPALFLEDFRRPFFLERREAEAPHIEAGLLRRHGLLASGSFGDDAWLAGVRNSMLSELSEPRHARDAEAGLVLAYYLELWGAE